MDNLELGEEIKKLLLILRLAGERKEPQQGEEKKIETAVQADLDSKKEKRAEEAAKLFCDTLNRIELPKWEYNMVSCKDEFDHPFIKMINEMGREGWEFIGDKVINGHQFNIFKRQILTGTEGTRGKINKLEKR